MLFIAAATWIVTFIVTLSILYTNINDQMLLIEDKSQPASSNRITALIPSATTLRQFGIQFENLERSLARLHYHIETISNHLSLLGLDIENTYAVMKGEIEKSESIQKLNSIMVFAFNVISKPAKKFYNYAIGTSDLHDILGIHSMAKWIFGIFVSISLLFILLSQRNAFINTFKSNVEKARKPVKMEHRPRRASFASRRAMSTCAQGALPAFVRRSNEDVVAIRKMYNKIFSILEESNFLSKKQLRMSQYTVLDAPAITDILVMLDPLQTCIQEGMHNLTLLSQEYVKQNGQLKEAEEKLKSIELYKGLVKDEQQLLAAMSEKDIEIEKLKTLVEQLKGDVNHFFNDSIRLSSELSNLGTQIKRQGSVNEDLMKLQKANIKESKEVQQFVESELQAEMELNKALKEEYSKNMQILLKMLLKSSQIGKVSFKSIETFLTSDMFAEFLRMGDMPTELGSDAVFKDFPQLATAYSDHLSVLKDCY